MKFVKYKILCLLLLFISVGLFGQKQKVGEEVLQRYESSHPYSGSENNESEVVWSQEIVYSGASYIAVHFSKVGLSKDDFIVVKSPDGERFWKYSNLDIKNGSQGFWSVHIYGEKAIIEIHSQNKKGNYGYSIDKIARGYLEDELEKTEAICGEDDSKEAKCYQSTEPQVYDKSKPVARLLINGVAACTGWLIGSDGHLMTNNHCIENASDANNVTIEFMAEGATCNTNCQSWFGCSGTIEATTTTLVQTDITLDYSLLELPNNVSGIYGFLQLRTSGPVLNERVYIPQHPKGWGKRITLLSDVDPGGFSVINSLSEPRCQGTGGGYDIGYYADTQGGSSGSPVLAYNDNLVVALHHCANCPNRGVAANEIISDLGSNLPTDAIGNCPSNLSHSGTINSDIYKADKTITSTGTIGASQSVTYHAGDYILLEDVFLADASNESVFLGEIKPCSSGLLQESTDVVYDYGIDKQTDVPEQMTADLAAPLAIKNYPNPFTGQTTVEFDLPEDAEVTLFVSDMTGRQIVRLLDNKPTLKGTHQIVFDGRAYPAGIYYYTIQAGSEVVTQKMTLMK